jgi:Flp pilus assembly secretin CpaC
MKTLPHRSVRPALAIALCAGLLWPLASARSETPPAPGGVEGSGGTDHAISVARRQMSRGELIAARATLKQALAAEGSLLAAPVVAEALELHKELQRSIRQANPVEIALQKAASAMDTGNLAEADLHLEAAAESGEACAAHAERLAALRADVEGRRAELAPMIPQALAQAVKDFESGRYGEAKAGFALVRRSGAPLDAQSLATLDGYQGRLVSLEEARGSMFAPAPSALALLQPGVVTEQDDPAGQPQSEQPRPVQTPDDIIAMAQAAEAQAQLRQADMAFEEARYSEAVRGYTNLQTSNLMQYLSDEERARAQARLDQSLVRMGRQPVGQDPIQDLARARQIEHDNALAEFNNSLRQAERALASGDYTPATNAVQQARVRLEGSRGVFAEPELNDLRRRADDVMRRIEAAQRQTVLVEQERLDRERRTRADETQRDLRRTRERVVSELIDQIRAFQREQRYAEAMDAVERLLNVDPRNPTGLLLRDIISDVQLYIDYEEAVRYKQRAINRLAVDNEQAAAPVPELVNYPVDWPSITLTRGGSTQFMDSAENRATLDGLQAPFPALTFEDHSLEQALGAVAEIRADLNFDIEWEALEAIGISRDTPLTLRLPEVPTHVALDRILGKVSDDDFARASWAVIDGIVTISSDERIRRHRKLFMYDMRDLLHEVPDYDEVPDIDLQNVLQGQQGGGGGQSPFRNDQSDEELDRRPLEERLRDIEELITELVDPNGWEVNGGDTGKMYQFQGSLVVVNTPTNHREISGLLGQLREQRAMQINVEARFLLVNQDFFERVGMDLDVYINTNNSQMRTLRANDPTLQGSDFFDFTQNRNPLRTVSGGGVQPVEQGVPAVNGFSPIGFSQNSFGLVNSLAPTSGMAADVLGSSPALGIAGQFLDDIQVDFLVEATQADRRSIQLTAPRLTFTNGQVANIYVATQQAFISDLEPVVGDSAVGFDPTVSVVSEGVTLLVDGTISADRRYVQLNVDTGIARIDGFQQQAVTAVAGGELVDSAQTSSFIALPTVTVTRVQTTVSVPDQGTVLLGGQRLITEFEVETGVPVLSKMPILNRFFTNRMESKEEQTLLILIKPTVLIQSEQEERNYPGLLDSAGLGFGG